MKDLLINVGTKAVEGRRNAICDFLNDNNISFELKEYSYSFWGECLKKLLNVYVPVNLPYKDDSKTLYLTAHYDVVKGKSLGYNDNGTGIVILLNLLKFLYEEVGELKYNTKVVFTDQEETGGMGAYNLCREMEENSIVINLDSCGFGNCVVADYRFEDNCELFDDICSNSIDYDMKMPPCDSSTFRMNGFPTLTICAAPESFIEVMYSMHNRKYDSLRYINFDIMERILNAIKQHIV